MNTLLKLTAIGALATGISTEALAYENYKSRQDAIRPYIGASYGRVDVNADQFEDDSDQSMSVYAGIDLGKTFGVELSYVDLGETQNQFFSTATDGFQLGGLAHLLNTDNFDLYIKGGVFKWDTDIDAGLISASSDGEELFWAVGSDIYLTKMFALRLEYTRYEVELEDEEVGQLASGSDFNLNKLSLGVKFSF